MSPVVYTKLKGVARGVSTSADAMPEEIAALLEKTLAVDVGERPATVLDILEVLGAAGEYGQLKRDMSDAVGGAALLVQRSNRRSATNVSTRNMQMMMTPP